MKTSTEKHFYFVRYWPLIVAVFILLAALQLNLGFIFPAKGQVINFWFLVNSRRLIPLLAFCAIPLSLFLVAVWIFIRPRKYRLHPLIEIISFSILLIANGLMCFSTTVLVFRDFGHFQKAILNDHVYYVDSIWKAGVGGDSEAYFALFECENTGTMCKIVHGTSLFPEMNDYEAIITRLIPDSATNSLALEINGMVVYTHPP